MQHRSWLGASVLGALVASVSLSCSTSDSQGDGAPNGGGTPATHTAGGLSGIAGSGTSIGGIAGTSSGGVANQAGGAGNQAGSVAAAGNGGTAGISGSGGGGGIPGGGSGGANTGGAGANTGGQSTGGGGQASGGGGQANGGGGQANGGGGQANGGGGAGGNPNSGPPTGAQIIAKLGNCTKVKGPFNPDGPNTGNIDVCQTGNVLWWKADLDVDCDGIQTSPCDTDNTGQPQTSIVDLAPSGDVDPTKLPYFVIPLGTPESEWYTAYGVELGQIGAVIYKGQVIYGIFADQAGGNFIGEASYKMCSLFIGANNCDPNNGGIDPLDVTYVTFTGTTPRASGQDIYSHDKHTALGEAAAKAFVGP